MDANKVLYINQEIFPYLPKSFEADLATSLHQGIQEKGFEVRTFMPKYGCINERRNQLHEVIRLSGMNLIINDTDHPLIIKVATLQSARMQVYFIYNDDYFLRSSAKAPETSLHPEDTDERRIFFVRGSLDTAKAGFRPSLLCISSGCITTTLHLPTLKWCTRFSATSLTAHSLRIWWRNFVSTVSTTQLSMPSTPKTSTTPPPPSWLSISAMESSLRRKVWLRN